MPRYFLEIAYDGTEYSGWQAQPRHTTVQSVLDAALSKLFDKKIVSLGCGRTDAGVHASQFFLHFDSDLPPHPDLIFRLSRLLPRDIAPKRIIEVADTAHARYDATYRAYDYYVHLHKNPFLDRFSFFFPAPAVLDIEKTRRAFDFLHSFSDFHSFEKSNDSKTSLCTLYQTQLIFDETHARLRFHIAANRFLRSMVRRIVGTVLWVGKGVISFDEYEDTVRRAVPFRIPITAPPQGLFLSQVRYPYLADTAPDCDALK